jgi:hypothetical protein
MVLGAESELAAGAGRSNCGVLDTGFDSTPYTLGTQLIRAQAARWPAIFEALGVPHRVPGALLLARTEERQARRNADLEPGNNEDLPTPGGPPIRLRHPIGIRFSQSQATGSGTGVSATVMNSSTPPEQTD